MDTQVVFIELSVPRKNRYVCDITEKLFVQGKKIQIFAGRKDIVLQLSRDLWVWKPDSFIPHGVYFGGPDEPLFEEEPVVVTTKLMPQRSDVLILYDALPVDDELKGFDLIVDFAEIYEKQKHLESRKRYKAFRDAPGFEVQFSKIGAFLREKRLSS